MEGLLAKLGMKELWGMQVFLPVGFVVSDDTTSEGWARAIVTCRYCLCPTTWTCPRLVFFLWPELVKTKTIVSNIDELSVSFVVFIVM